MKKHGLFLNKEDFLKKYPNVDNEYIIQDDYVNDQEKCTITCKDCGKSWHTRPYVLAIGKARCPYCKGAKTNIDTLYLSELLKGKFEVLSECDKAEDVVTFKHIKCGNIFDRKVRVLLKHKSCPYCKVNSKGEEVIKEILLKNNVNFKRECAFKDLRGINGGYLRFDFGIYDKNKNLKYFIEYDGKQHFEPVDYKYYGENYYEKCKKHDEIKDKYCKDNNYVLLRINYNKRRTIEPIVLSFLNQYMLIPSQANES